MQGVFCRMRRRARETLQAEAADTPTSGKEFVPNHAGRSRTGEVLFEPFSYFLQIILATVTAEAPTIHAAARLRGLTVASGLA